MLLFEIRNGHVFPTVFALRTEPYKSMWYNDTSEDRQWAYKCFDYIEFTCSPSLSNPYYGYSEDERTTKIREVVFGDKDYEIDTELLFATMAYKEHLASSSPSYQLLVDAEVAKDKLQKFLREFNFDERTNGGAMIIKPKDITNALKDIATVAKQLTEARVKVHTELIDATKTRNDRIINHFEK